MSPWKVILATVIIFATGVITGGLLVQRTQRPERPGPLPPFARPPQDGVPTPWFARREFLERMDRQLNLSREQYDHIAKIIQTSQEHTREIMGSIRPEIQDELRHVRREIRSELTPDQAKKFDELQRQMRRPDRPPGDNPDMRRGPGPGPNRRNLQPPSNEPRPETNNP